MKRLLSVVAIFCIMALVMSATGCGSSQKSEQTTTAAVETTTEAAQAQEDTEEVTEAPAEETTEAAAEETTEAAAEETTEAAAAADGDLTPDIVIELGDYDAIEALAKDAQNMKVEEGTVVKITGLAFTGTLSNSVMEDNGEGQKKGLVIYIDGDFDFPKDNTEIEVIGTMTKGTYAMEYHALPENITIK